MIKSILIVCTGNSCRSVMAQWLLRKFLKERGCEDIEVLSAGIGTMPGMMASPNTIEVMKQEGIDVSAHRAQFVTEEMIKKADLILGMQPIHIETVLDMVPEAKDKARLLLEYAYESEEGVDAGAPTNLVVFDPIGKPKEVYESVLLTIKDAVERVVKRICESQ